MTLIRRCLPGIRFQTQPAPLDEALPRMDIAVFVGFALQGELNRPTVVESVDQFVAFFGEDVPLAWDAERGEVVYGYLASAVRAFFRNGGRRAWIIRVATPAPDQTPVQLDQWDAALFLDPRLAETSVEQLLTEATYLRYLGSDQTQPLTGIHAALEVEEATIIAVPDAVHVGWRLAATPLPAPPQLVTLPAPTDANRGEFLSCAIRSVAMPLLTLADEPVEKRVFLRDASVDTSFPLRWQMPPDSVPQKTVVRFVLQEATHPDFSDATPIYTVEILYPEQVGVVIDARIEEKIIYGRSLGDYYYRVRAEVNGNRSAWSLGLAVRIAPKTDAVYKPSKQYANAVLVAVQQALLRLCAARADLFAILALPAHYRAAEAIDHAENQLQLSSSNAVNAAWRSYGALYHPWLIGHEENRPAELRRTPPDGAICGILAQRALQRGGWIAPANQPLQAVIGLTPPLARQQWLRLQAAQVNLIRQVPRDFLCMSADTLSNDPDLRPINVRRLLSLLRRLALREGTRYVFEPNDDSFRRMVQRNFEALLEQLFLRGAFAGKSARSAYQVVTERTLNPPTSVEQGRFIIELRVAPVQPLTFLTVRLVQTNERLLVNEVR